MNIQEELIHKSNDDLIQFAVDVLKKKQPTIDFNLKDYYIKVWKGANGVAVDFTRIIQYTPLYKADQKLAFDIVVNLTNQEIIPFINPDMHGEFYIPSSTDIEALAFIKKHFGVFTSQFENTIHEGATEYHISCDNDASFGRYTVNKQTGEQGPAIQGSYEPMIKPLLEDDPLEDID